MRNKLIAVIVIIFVVFAVSGAIAYVRNGAGKTTLNMTGGDPSFGTSNQTMVEFNKSLGYTINVVDPDHVTDYPDMTNVDLVQGGTLSATDDLKKRDDYKNGEFKIYGEYVMATSANMLWVKSNPNSDEFGALVDAGFIVPVENYFTISPANLTTLILAEINDQTYRDIGVNSDKKVKIGFPNSSGGRTSIAQLLACAYNNCEMVTPDQFENDPRYKAALYTLYVNGGKQPAATYSVEFCKQWLNSMNRPDTLAIFPESCYGAWKLELSDAQKENAEARGNVGVYISMTVVQQFTLIATSEEGLAYLNTIRDAQNADNFAIALTESTGMRGTGLASVPPTSLAPFIAYNEPYEPMVFPFNELTSLIKEALKSYGN